MHLRKRHNLYVLPPSKMPELQAFGYVLSVLEYDMLNDFFADSLCKFEQSFHRKLASINHPRLSFGKQERSFDLHLHPTIFSSSLARNFWPREVRHSPPLDDWHYTLDTLRRLRSVAGQECCLVKRRLEFASPDRCVCQRRDHCGRFRRSAPAADGITSSASYRSIRWPCACISIR